MTITLPALPTRPTPRRKRAYVQTGAVGKHLTRAAVLQAQIQALQAEYDTERTWLLAHMQQRDLATLSLGEVRCLLKARSSWTYSPETEREMQQLRVTQRWEQKQGIATNTPSFYVALTTTPEPVQ